MKGKDAPHDILVSDVARLFTLGRIAKEFGVLPSEVARDLDEDPEQSALVCSELLHYAEAYSVFRSNNKKMIEAWDGDTAMEAVKQNEFDLFREERGV